MPQNQPAKMWSGRFREPLNRTFEQWQRSVPFDCHLLPHEGVAWKAHARANTANLRQSKLLRRTVAVCCFGLLLPLISQSQRPEDGAHVTFYTHESSFTTGMPGSRHGVFAGGIFRDKQLLFLLRKGSFAKNNLFLSIDLPPGTYRFAAGPPKRDGDYLTVSLDARKQYFFRAQTRSDGIMIVESMRGLLEQVPCPTAIAELAHAKPLDPKKVSLAKDVLPLAVQTTSFDCASQTALTPAAKPERTTQD